MMISARRLSVAFAVVSFPLIAFAQEIASWPAPPYWNPPARFQKPEKGNSDNAPIGVESIEAVPTPPLPFTGINPCRIVDTRGNGFTGTYGPPALVAGVPRSFTLTGQCGISGAAQAVSLNVTVTNTQGPGHIVIYPEGGVQPTVSTLNYVAGQTVANAAVVPLGASGGITVVAGVSATDLIIDTNGYYAPQLVVNTLNDLSGAVTLAPGTNVTITPSGQTLTIAASGAGAAWSLTGNSGTIAGTNFLGTTDNQALELKVSDARVLRLEPNATSPNVIGGWSGNSVTSGALGATIAGGGTLSATNRVTDDYGSVLGGVNNRAGDASGTTSDHPYATVAGGFSNTANGADSFIGGGSANTTTDTDAVVAGGTLNHAAFRGFVGGGLNNTAAGGSVNTVAGGSNNMAGGSGSAIGGGTNNEASGISATVPGGDSNFANGNYSFAAGRQAKTNYAGVFVWGDSTAANVASTGADQFIVRASGGMWFGTTSSPSFDIATDFLRTSTGAHLTIGGVWTDNSDRDSKENFQQVDKRDVLFRLVSLPITRWSYKAEGCDIEHLGPMAQDFSAAFGLGSDERSISTLDSSGVALAAIQGLYEIVKEKDGEIEKLKARLSKLESALK